MRDWQSGEPHHWLAETKFHPPQPPDTTSRLENAARFLLQLLAAGPLPYKEIEEQSRAAGHAMPTIRRAKHYLAVQSVRLPGESQWRWSLPPDDA